MTSTTSNTHGGKRANAGRKPGPTATANERFTLARAQKEEALARLRQAEADEREGRLLRADDVAEAVTLAHAAVAQTLLTLPDEMERAAGLSPEQAELVERTLHNAMDALADRLATLAPPDVLEAAAMVPGS